MEPIVLGTPLEHLFRTTIDAQGTFIFRAVPRDAKASLVVTAAGTVLNEWFSSEVELNLARCAIRCGELPKKMAGRKSLRSFIVRQGTGEIGETWPLKHSARRWAR